ncbi:MAG TPA: alpha/beta hydrolase [Leptospiraceae bacterium]|nr:alpha/beta hydrolase [Leptospiraceae bacterium]HMW05935.1 alpha/beta hydrolase [Leptospiraceae bacterium]HMX34553.1 alpha/beta hydrolase [Leptospiraceae bacterium]HMY32289.1 alpha/beta hydrolase [Leptospiraceae bacterium]HMZ62509.1 alpha/beta hydrolase [Leptospiraceae bacterium]
MKSSKSEPNIIFKRKFFTFENLKLSYIDTETNSKDIILITHANGYSAECYSYLIEAFANEFRVIALDFAGHGESDPYYDFSNWDFLRDQILALIELENLDRIISIGHSMGGASALRASKKKTSHFKKMFLLDPTFLSIPIIVYGKIFGSQISQNAAKRRRHFKNLEVVRRSFRKFSAFSNWDNRVFEDYLRSCFRKKGEEIELICDPTIEAKYFKTPSLKSFKDYGKNKLETHIIIPQKFEVCSPYRAKIIISGNKHSTLTILPDGTHFFPFEKPDFTIQKIKDHIR